MSDNLSLEMEKKKVKKLREALYELMCVLDISLKSEDDEVESVEIAEKCPGCGELTNAFHLHHIVPKSVGGLDEACNIARICELCHSKIHMRKNVSLSELIKKGVEKKRKEDPEYIHGRPSNLPLERIKELRDQGHSIRQISKILKSEFNGSASTSKGSVQNALKKIEYKGNEYMPSTSTTSIIRALKQLNDIEST